MQYTGDIVQGDCLELMRALPDCSIDSIVTDPPYALTANKKGGSGVASIDLSTPQGRSRISSGNGPGGFMGQRWDEKIPGVEVWGEALRIVKPGAYLLAFGGDRTFHRLTCAIEDAGWEIRHTLCWLYGTGFAKGRRFLQLDVIPEIEQQLREQGVEGEITWR